MSSSKVTGRVAVIGAGVAGVAAATALKKASIDFVVYEKQEGVGGLWYQNYPGASGTSYLSPLAVVVTVAVRSLRESSGRMHRNHGDAMSVEVRYRRVFWFASSRSQDFSLEVKLLVCCELFCSMVVLAG